MSTNLNGSEFAFEQFCRLSRIPCARIRAWHGTNGKTPDFRVGTSACRVFIEVKDLELGEGKPLAEALRKQSMVFTSYTAVDKIHKKIKESRKQLRDFRPSQVVPRVLVICDAGVFGGITQLDITDALFGKELVSVAEGYYMTKRGGGQALRSDHNKHLSALGVLHGEKMDIYHNPFATTPLSVAPLVNCRSFFWKSTSWSNTDNPELRI